jgi:hypothetical protein
VEEVGEFSLGMLCLDGWVAMLPSQDEIMYQVPISSDALQMRHSSLYYLDSQLPV